MSSEANPVADNQDHRDSRRNLWLVTSIGVHILAWGALFAFLCLVVPMQMQVFADFDVPVSRFTLMMITMSDFLVHHWFVSGVMVLALIVATDWLVITFCRPTLLRAGLILGLTATPVIWIVIAAIPFFSLQESLQ